ncbi:MAG: glutamine--fructose-6-phosphate transaminase (isomerizing), partial [archaeon]
MCGIIGYVGEKNCAQLLISGLKSLEYRGYDSAGIVVIDSGKKFRVRKSVGRVSGLEAQVNYSSFLGTTGIAHTRWATHGKPSIPNSHPHFDPKGIVGVVHNGIVENFVELKEGLISRGAKFSSETDTEIIAHLIAGELANSSGRQMTLEGAVARILPLLQGSYALGVVSPLEPGKIVAARKSSPLVIGVGKGENFLASDVPAFLAHTRNAMVLEDGELAVLTKKGVSITKDGKKIRRPLWKISWSPEAAKLNGYPHYMLKEIEEQPETLPAIIAQDEKVIRKLTAEMRAAKRIVMVACGTSRHAALIGRYLLVRENGLYCDVLLASEFSHFAGSLGKGTLVIAISQSGETADVMESVRAAKKQGAKVYSIVNVVGSSLTRESDGTIYMRAGPEIGVAATKTFSATIMTFYLLAQALNGKYRESFPKVREAARLLRETIEANKAVLKKIAAEYKHANAFYFIGRGINFAAAIEGALKLKEISYIHAEGMPAGELKHGSLALVGKGIPIVSINPTDDTYEETVSNTMEVKAREGSVIGISNRPNPIYNY